MKRSEIEVGGRYGNGKGSVREVLGFPKTGPYHGVRFKILASRYNGSIGIVSVMTARSFASWVKNREEKP